MSNRIYVGNLPDHFNENKLAQLFSPYGKISKIKLLKDSKAEQFMGIGFLDLDDEKVAEKAVADLNGKKIEQSIIKVDFLKTSYEKKPN